MLSSKKTVSPPAGQERKQKSLTTTESPSVVSPSGMGDKSPAGKSLPQALHSFLGVIQNVATDGFKLMTCVGSVLTDQGLPELASHLHKCLTDITQSSEIEEFRAVMEKLHKVPLDEKNLLTLLSVFLHTQVDVLEKAAHRLRQLLHCQAKGQELEKYLPPVDGQGGSLVTRLSSQIQTTATQIGDEGREDREEGAGAGNTQAMGDLEKLHLVSEQEMKDVIDLLSGRKAPPPPVAAPPLSVPHPTQTPSSLLPTPSQLVFNPTPENNTPPVPTHKLPPPPVPQKPPPHLLHPHNLVLENTHCPLRPQGSLDSALPKAVKTNTWPLRPGRQQAPVTIPAPAPNFPYDGFSSDLEFSQFVNSVRQRAGVRMGSKARENPWGVVGDPSWSPLMYDSREGRQWSTAEDSSNCSDESSSNGDWMIGPELMSSRLNTTGAPGMQRGEVTQQNSLTQEMQGLAVTGEGTHTWPLKQQWIGMPAVAPPVGNGSQTLPANHMPLGLSYSEPQTGAVCKPWDMSGY